MDIGKRSEGERLAAASAIILATSAIILAIVMFVFPWFELGNGIAEALSATGVDTTFNAWQSFSYIDFVLLATILLAITTAVIMATETHVDASLSTIVTVLGALSTILVLFRILDPPSDAARKYGVFLGLVFAAALTYGGWLAMQSEGTSFEEAADRLGGSEPPPPPPPSG